MAAATITQTYFPNYFTMTGTDIDAGNNDITLMAQQINFGKGFSIQTGTLTAMNVTVLDSVDGSVYVDNTSDYLGAGVTVAASDSLYKVDLKAPVHSIKIRAVRSNATNAVTVKVLCPNR